jgi:hypothetical protein
MQKATYLSSQLRESSPYLRDAGFKETAKLVTTAADEIEALRALIEQHLPEMKGDALGANENIKLRSSRSVKSKRGIA